MSANVSDLDVQEWALQNALGNLHTCMPAEVVRVHEGAHKRQFVDVLPGLMRTAPNEDGELVDEALPVLPMVPVGYYQGGGFFISVPLKPGDVVLVVFAERSMDQWLEVAKKGGQRAINPGDVSMHSLEGAIALPCGPAPRSALLANVSATDLVIAHDSGARIHLSPLGVIHAGDDAGAEFVALAGKVATELDRIKTDLTKLKTAIGAGFVAVGIAAAADGGKGKLAFESSVAPPPAIWPSSPASVAATKLKTD
jgi:hypothetical protein